MKKDNKHFIHPKIEIKEKIYLVMFFVTFVLSIVHFVNGHIRFYFPLGGFVVGLLIGIIVSREQKITWDEKGEKIIGEFDIAGLIILIAYLGFVIFKNYLIEHIVHLHHIGSITMAITSGIMLSRYLMIKKKVINKINENNNQSPKS